ncbi:hypothetical protein AMK31_10425 [Streptomyces sp. TSRI0107]|nr:hypothetical protein AMK31_10425 [Streptomyces sp. TSRI0107]
MSGSWPEPAQGHLAEQHLGDRLAALVDGELGHDARERVLAHVATCPKCKAEVDAQRRLKNVFAEVAPPPPSESFLARLQGLPAGGDLDGGTPFGGGGPVGGFSGRPGAGGVFGVRRGGERFEFDYVPAGPHSSSVLPETGRGFRIHEVGRPDAERGSRGRRFAFVAAGAVSLAAIALGGVTTGVAPGDAEARNGSGSNVTPLRSSGAGATSTPDSQRRRAPGPLLAQGQGGRLLGETPAAPTQASAPLLPGVTGRRHDSGHALTAPMVAGAAAMSPLIRPLSATPPISLTAWSMAPEATAPGLLAASPTPDPSATSASASPRTPR